MILKKNERVYWLILLILLEGMAFLFFGYDFVNNDQFYREYMSSTDQEDQFRELERNIGYGNFIHSFKNFLLRGEFQYYDQAKLSAKVIYKNCDELKRNENEEVVKNFEIIKSTISSYEGKLNEVKEKRDKGISIQQIDRDVRIDDGPAKKAMGELSNIYHHRQRNEMIKFFNEKRDVGMILFGILVLIVFTFISIVLINYKDKLGYLEFSKRFFADVISEIDNPIFIFNSNNEITFENPKASLLKEEFGLSGSLKSMNTLLQAIEPTNVLENHLQSSKLVPKKVISNLTFLNNQKGSLEVSLKFPFKTIGGSSIYGILMVSDKTDFIQTFRGAEVQHRIKNNLAFLSSIIGLLRSQNRDEAKVCDALSAVNKAVISIGTMYKEEISYGDKDGDELEKYLLDLSKSIRNISPSSDINLVINVDKGVNVTSNNVIPIGLIFSELLTNSLKHNIDLALTLDFKILLEGDKYRIEYRDNGKPIDLEKIKESKSLGQKIIKILTQQLEMKLDISYQGGNKFTFIPRNEGDLYENTYRRG